MTHLVKKHDTGEYCLSEGDPSTLIKECEESGDQIILSWEKGERLHTLESYFSKVKSNDRQVIDGCRKTQTTKDEMTILVRRQYFEDREMITDLFEQDIISKGELRRFTKINRQAEIKQLEIVRDCFRFHSIINTVSYKNRLLLKRTKQ